MPRCLLSLAPCMLLQAVLTAQISVGEQAPVIKPKELINTKAQSLEAFEGHLILFEYFAYG